MGSGTGKRAALKLARSKAAGQNIVKATDRTRRRKNLEAKYRLFNPNQASSSVTMYINPLL
jgi:hypothetical protein